MNQDATKSLTLCSAIQRLAEGRHAGAWEHILRHAGPRILSVSRHILRDEALAEDAVQETLLQLRDYAGALVRQINTNHTDADDIAMRLIMRMACNTALRMLRSRRRSAQRDSVYAQQQAARIDDVERNRVDRETAELVQNQLQQLPEEQRLPIVMHYHGQMEYVAIARELQCPVGTAKARVHRGLQALRDRLALLGLLLPVDRIEAYSSWTSSSTAALETQRLAQWQVLLSSPKKAAAAPFTAAGGWSIMAKSLLGVSAIAACAVVAVLATDGRSQEAAPVVQAPTPKATSVEIPGGKVSFPTKTADGRVVQIGDDGRIAVITHDGKDVRIEKFMSFIPVDAPHGRVWMLDQKKWAEAPFDVSASAAPRDSWSKYRLDKKTYWYRLNTFWDIKSEKAVDAVMITENDPGIEAPGQIARSGNLDRLCTFEFVDTPLSEAIEFFRSLTTVPINLTAEANEKAKTAKIDLRVTDLSLRKSLELVAEQVELGLVVENEVATIGPKLPAQDASPQSPDAELMAKLNRKVTFEFVDTPLEEGLNFLNQLARVNVVMLPEAREQRATPITLRVQDLAMSTALFWMLRLSNMRYAIVDNVIKIDVDHEQRSMAEFAAALRSITVDPATAPEMLIALAKNAKLKMKISANVLEAVKDLKVSKGSALDAMKKLAESDLLRLKFSNDGDAEILRNDPQEWITACATKLQRKVTFEFADTPLEEAISFIRSLANVTMIESPELAADKKVPHINLKVADITLSDALSRILKQCGAKAVYQDQALYIDSTERLIFTQDFSGVVSPSEPTPASVEKPKPQDF